MRPIRIGSISDVHAGHRRLPIPHTVSCLEKFFFPKIKDMDFLIIGGDWYDSTLSLNDEHIDMLLSCMGQLLMIANEHNVMVRILRGTFLHDRTQLMRFQMLYDMLELKNDFKYVTTVTAEYIEKYDMRVAYLPDDLPYASEDEVMQLLRKNLEINQWEKYDYAFNHGLFKHTLPDNIPRKQKIVYDKDDFAEIATRTVSGHVHIGSQVDSIIYNGSFDRTNQGEEGAKGFLYIDDEVSSAKIQFIENTDAIIHLTYDVSKLSDIDLILQRCKTFAERKFSRAEVGYLRILHPSPIVRSAIKKVMTRDFENLICTPETKEKSEKKNIELKELYAASSYPVPTIDNMEAMIKEFLITSGANNIHTNEALEIYRKLSNS